MFLLVVIVADLEVAAGSRQQEADQLHWGLDFANNGG